MKTIFAGPWQMRDDGWSAPDVGPITATLDLSDNLQRNSDTAGDGATERGCGLWQAECEPAGIPDGYTVLGVTDWSEITFGATERDAWDSLFRVSLPSSITTLQQACVYSLLDGSDPTGEGTPPLWPYRAQSGGYHLTIQFGSSRYSERFTRLHTHALTRWIPHIHAELRRMWAISQQHCAEWLGWLFHEITVDTGIAPDPATTTLIPADLRSEGLLPAEFHSSYSDNFNDGDLTGWTQGRGMFTNPGTVCRCIDAGNWLCLTYTSTLSGSNHYSQAKINHTGSSGVGVWNRRSTVDGPNEGYISYFRPADTSWRIARLVGGVATFVYTSGAQALTAWDTVYGASSGSLHTIARNGSAFNSGGTTDTQYPTGSRIGLVGTAGTREYDDWLAADFVSGIPAHAQHYFRQRVCS